MTAAVIFVEEEYMRIVLLALLQKISPGGNFIVVSHSGKSDLRRSFPRKIGAWNHPEDVPFIVLHDNDGGTCTELKAELIKAVPAARLGRTKIRIVMNCLESWYLGDLMAIELAGLITSKERIRIASKAKFRDPDLLVNAKQEFFRLHNECGQLLLAQTIGPHLDPDRNASRSFNMLMGTIKAISD